MRTKGRMVTSVMVIIIVLMSMIADPFETAFDKNIIIMMTTITTNTIETILRIKLTQDLY